VVTAHCHRVEVVTKGWLLMGLVFDWSSTRDVDR
jgi:hypothetical protein